MTGIKQKTTSVTMSASLHHVETTLFKIPMGMENQKLAMMGYTMDSLCTATQLVQI